MTIGITIRLVASQKDVPMTVPITTRADEIIDALIKGNFIKSHDDSNRRIQYSIEHSITRNILFRRTSLKDENVQNGDLLFLLELSRNRILGTKLSSVTKVGSIASGLGLISLGIWDGISNPFNFMNSKELFVAGVGLITIGMNSGKK